MATTVAPLQGFKRKQNTRTTPPQLTLGVAQGLLRPSLSGWMTAANLGNMRKLRPHIFARFPVSGSPFPPLLGDAPRTVLEEFARVKSGDVVLPTRDPDGRPGRTLRVRCVTMPDESQRVLLSRLALPERLRWQEEIPPPENPRHARQM
jgi:hypothetical protein